MKDTGLKTKRLVFDLAAMTMGAILLIFAAALSVIAFPVGLAPGIIIALIGASILLIGGIDAFKQVMQSEALNELVKTIKERIFKRLNK